MNVILGIHQAAGSVQAPFNIVVERFERIFEISEVLVMIIAKVILAMVAYGIIYGICEPVIRLL